ncbi:MAG: neutral/alkaline non-lysosomal ceramidase N-terminal domain-containing protein, partial [Planctomycetaceae bacterium]|nr:neutral/alkaline non-lysosomal ceramidase N-terminal domain-containing protein [Planctomycetaceae bacterium]
MQMRLTGTPNDPVARWALSAGMAVLGVVFSLSSVAAAETPVPLLVGEGVVDISPPLGTALGGFHYSDPTRPRVTTAIHYPPEVRALVLSRSKMSVAIISFDMLNVSFALVGDVQRRIKSQLGIPAKHVRICATHAHSMPSIAFNRHWGDNNPEYEETVARAMLKAVRLALKDQSTTRLFVGTARAVGANVNRTVRSGARSDAEFTADSTEKDRWVDASLHVLHFERGGGQGNLLWYNFAAHPTTYG